MQTPFIVKAIIVLALLAILASLALALVRLNQDRGQTSRTVKALTVRIGLSIALFLLIVVGFMTGLVVPHGVVP
jgi:uncharacterized membrane protein